MTRRSLGRLIPLLLRILAASALSPALAAPVAALPLYASREGMTCINCHMDPNGGGIRNDFGFNYGKNRHAMDEEERWSGVTVDPQITDWVRLGLDTRIMYYASHQNGVSGLASSSFFPMEGQLRVAIEPYDNLKIVGTQGIVVSSPGFPDSYVARELYGLFHGLPYNGFVQVGRFRIPFGLRQDDHTSFVRTTPDFLPYDSQKEDAGIEIGSIGKNAFGQLSFTNGGEPFGQRAQTFAEKVGWTSKAAQAGLSGYHRYSERIHTTYNRWSLYASTTRGRFTVLGEYAGGTTESPFITTNVGGAFGELDYRFSRGVNLRAKVDWLDRRKQFPGLEKRRYLVDADFVPMPFTEIKLSYRYYDDDLAGFMSEYFAMLFLPF